jgi:flagellar assembly factor FliW
VLEENVIRFPDGIPGFEGNKDWCFLGEQEHPVKWLQNLEDGSIALPIMAPQAVCPEYDAKVPDSELEVIRPENVDDLVLVCVVAIPPDAPWNMTVNLRAPIVINKRLNLGRQVIALNEEYGVRHLVFPEETRRRLSDEAAKIRAGA